MSQASAATIDYVEFPVSDTATLQQTKTFYQTVFGWQYKQWGEDYVDTTDSGIGSGLTADSTQSGRSALVVVRVDDLEQAWQAVQDAGGVIVHDIFAFPGGRRFHFTDPAGNELAVWSPDSP